MYVKNKTPLLYKKRGFMVLEKHTLQMHDVYLLMSIKQHAQRD